MTTTRSTTRLILATAALSAGACGPAPPAPPVVPAPAASPPRTIRFTDVSADTGIDVVTVCGTLPSREILEVNGTGLALIDYDDDGDLDLFVTNGATMESPGRGPGCRLYANDGDLRFRDVTASAGITLDRWATGVAVGDYDGDGHDDLYVCAYGANALLRNGGDGTFTDVTAAAGVGDERWGTSAAFGDPDGDGDLDLYVVNYVVFDVANPPPRARHKGFTVMNGPHGLPGQADVYYENAGDGTFVDRSESAGCLVRPPAYGLNVVILDFDGDGRSDILVGNDSMANFMFRSKGDGTFDEIGMAAGVASNMDGGNQATMGMAVADVDGNQRPDVFTTNFANDTNTLHLNIDGLFYDDRTQQYGLGLLSRPYLGWATWFADFDHDGDEDLIVFNGHVYPEATQETMDSEYEQPPLLFARDGRRFRRVGADVAGSWLDEPHRDRTAAFGDLDQDGDVDVVVGELNGSIRVLRNEAADGTPDWLIVTLHDRRPGVGNHRGLGARIELTAGDTSARRWMISGGGFQSASAPEVHFGRPPGAPETGTVTVHWPDGGRTEAPVEFGRRVAIER